MRELTDIKGIGAKRAEVLESMGIMTAHDLIRYAPKSYIDFTEIKTLDKVYHGERGAFELTVDTPPKIIPVRTKNRLTIVSCKAHDESGSVNLVWYNQPYMMNAYRAGETIYVYGTVDENKGKRIPSPKVFKTRPDIVPVYRVKKGISQKVFAEFVRAAIFLCDDFFVETLPENILSTLDLASLRETYNCLHFPKSSADIDRAKRRLAFEDALYFSIAVNLLRNKRKKSFGIAFDTDSVLENLTSKLAFSLTKGQLDAISDISADMRSSYPMNRLLQGDVGSGKTLVAIFAMMVAGKNGYQSAMLAPTEILAVQHYNTLCGFVPKEEIVLLTGSITKKERERVYTKIADGTAKYVVGTHAILSAGVEFSNPGLIVCDEQHRFGVSQRATLKNKNTRADVLVMSATPIPRTLSMTLYGDLDVSMIKELPSGRKAVVTRTVTYKKRQAMYRFLADEAKQGKQAYVVCPMIEESGDDNENVFESVNDVYTELKATLDVNIGLLHGKMKSAQKEAVINAFRNGEIDILVSTTVIEVGVDIPTAANIAIENADRFGLAQLHQLRGRVGRGKMSGYCFLLAANPSDCERLKVLCETNDGFLIAKRDLELRGPGQFLGTEQHGAFETSFFAFADNMEIINCANEFADSLTSREFVDTSDVLIKNALRRLGISMSDIVLN